MSLIPQNSWVEVEQVILNPEQRAPTLPEDTRQTPYIMRVSGFLEHDAKIGQECTIRTLIGRKLQGTLIVVNPSYTHSFGTTVPELLTIGNEVER